MAHPAPGLGNEHGSFVFLPLLPWSKPSFQCGQWALSLSETDVYAYVAQAINPAGRPIQSGSKIAIQDVWEAASRGRDVLVNGQVFFKATCEASAWHYAALIEQLRRTQVAEVSAAIAAALRHALDPQAVQLRVADLQKHLAWLRAEGCVLFFLMMVAFSASLFVPAIAAYQLMILIAIAACMIDIVRRFYAAHCTLMPAAHLRRLGSMATMILMPPAAIRASDFLGRQLLAEFHPLAVAAALCPRDEFRRFAREVILDLLYPIMPICPSKDEVDQIIESDFRQQLLVSVTSMVRNSSEDPEGIIKPPQPDDPSCVAYCPRCERQFYATAGACDECGGIPLTPFAQ
ncbi:MAG: hypothetical protein FWD61_20025 [Phycisphaerales bacterium]|nr:hypothetical protein [Phycisphaerales bacterium]